MRILTSVLLVALVTVSLAGVATADPARYMRHPSLSPDNHWVAFSYRGDIWRVAASGGRAERLTVHPDRDMRPIWSPDGTQIAFASNREGQHDIYVIPAAGGPARRATFHSADEFPCDWSSDGAFILIERYGIWRPDLFELPLAGGPARPVTEVPGEAEYSARYSHDGKEILFCDGRGYINWNLEGSKSSRAGQLWTLKRGTWPPEVKRITPEGTQFLWPGYTRNGIVATANTTLPPNVARLANDGTPTALTTFSDDGVQWLRVSRDGTRAVFEQGLKLWQIDLRNDSTSEISVEAPSDWIREPRQQKSIDGKIEQFTLSADGNKIVFAAGGDLYLIPSDDPDMAKRLTATDARERFPAFSPDGKTVAYVSDRTGRQNLYSVDTRSGEEVTVTSLSDADIARPQYAPDGSTIAFYLSNNRIARISPDGGKIDTMLIGSFFDFPLESTQEFRFSPDSRYIAYTAFGRDYNTDIWVYALEDGTNINTTRWSQYNYDPHWSPDGAYLSFTHQEMRANDIYSVRLEQVAPEFAEARLDSLYDDSDEDDEADDGTPEVRIDFDGIQQRWNRVMPIAGEQAELIQTPDGKSWIFAANVSGSDQIWKTPVDSDSDDKPKQLTSGSGSKSQLAISPDSKTVYFLSGGKINKVGIDGKEQSKLSFKADYDYRVAAQNRQKLNEVWRTLGNYFYDPELHGAAWDQLLAKYTQALPHIALEDELRDLLKEFIGGLDASHLDIYGGRPGLSASRQTGFLGVTFDSRALRKGRYVIGEILSHGPLDEADTPAQPGDTLIGINGHTIDSSTDIDTLLYGTIGDRVILTLRSGAGEKDVAVKPVSSGANRTLWYNAWVDGRRRYVDSISSGRLGYMHIRAMNQPALDKFKRELISQTSDHEGLVIDVRYNGGGWIAVHVLGMIERQPFVMRNFRGANIVSENKSRSYAVEKPMILLINHYSASNSEIFAEGWRTLGLGKIVGYPTPGAVIGTSAYPLIDGTICRRPSWGAFTVGMENLEGNGRQPDINIFNTQHDWISGHDRQLQRATEELLGELQ